MMEPSELVENGTAYFRDFNYCNQCEMQFYLDTEVRGIGWIKEEIKAVRQRSDTVASLLQHIRNKIKKILLDKKMENLELSEKENIENNLTNVIDVCLTRGNKHIEGSMNLKDVPTSFNSHRKIILQVCEQKFTVTVNAPLIKQIKLPFSLFVNFSVQPSKFQTMYTDNKASRFCWYKSIDKLHWKEIGTGFVYVLNNEDFGHYIKLVCVPINEFKIEGPSAQDISETKVDRIGKLPACPFEKRHKYTQIKLQGLRFRVVSYNTLSDRYTADLSKYTYCSIKALAIDYRKQLILKELLGYKADVICLQEVDNKQYSNYFKEQLKKHGYTSLYHRKGNRISEGLACFFNKSRYKTLESKHIVLSMEVQRHKVFSYIWDVIKKNEDLKSMFLKQSTSLQVTVLSEKESKKCIIVGNTHLFYHPDADHIRLLQINMATAYLNMIKRRYLKDKVDVSVVFCGDFNSNPEKSLFSFMIQGRINKGHEDCKKIYEKRKGTLYHEFTFKSACGTPKYTNYTPDFKGCLDYIFIESDKVEVEQVVPIMDEEELNQYEGLPNDFFPSDHLALVADLRFK